MSTDDDQSLDTALEELERSARSIARFAEQLRASPETVGSVEVLALSASAEELSAEIQVAHPSGDGD
jgi:hypothetical protein